MVTFGKNFAPALIWRAFFVCTLALTAAHAAPPAVSAPPLAQTGKPDAAEAARILDQFRHSGWFGYIEFELRALPRRGEETVYRGRLWGGRNAQGAVSRIELTDAKGTVRRLLLQNGERAAVWRWLDGKVAPIDVAGQFEPLIPGVEINAFDLQMPYLYWPDVKVERVARVRGRPAYEFVFRPPAAFAAAHRDLNLVRTYFDAQYSAPVQTELADARRVVKTTSLVDLKKVGEQWIPKSFDVRNDVTHDKTRFQVTAAALNLDFGPAVFAPAALGENIGAPAADKIVRIEP